MCANGEHCFIVKYFLNFVLKLPNDYLIMFLMLNPNKNVRHYKNLNYRNKLSFS